MARVRALFVSWVCTSLMVSITLTAAACGAPREDVAGPTLATPSAAPTRTAQADYTPAHPSSRWAAGICVRHARHGPHGRNRAGPPARRHTRHGPCGRNRAGKRPPAATPATAPAGATEQANDPPPSATPRPPRPPRAQPSRQTTPRLRPRLPRRHQRPGTTSPRAHAGPARNCANRLTPRANHRQTGPASTT